MPSSRILGAVLHNFLGTLISRYSDYGGYWLFGCVVEDLAETDVDLFGVSSTDEANPVNALRALARLRFQEQLAKSGLPRQRVSNAVLHWRRSKLMTVPSVWGPKPGYQVVLEAVARLTSGKAFTRTKSEYVLAHNPNLEQRSGRVA